MHDLEWLRKNAKYFNISAIGEELGIKDQLLKAIKGVRNLPEKHENSLKQFINNLIKL